jgi:hypothetical protein
VTLRGVAPALVRAVVLAAAALATVTAGCSPGASPEGSPGVASGPAGDGPVLVAVVDTGIDPEASLDGRLDTSRSRSVVPGEGVDDRDGHGTEVAAVVHANAPGAQIAAIKASGADGTSDERLAAAVDHAADAGASVILVSLAGAEPLPLARAAIERAGGSGALVVVAAGNDGVDVGDHPTYPAAYPLANLVPVAAVDREGHLLGSSNRGEAVKAAARGVAVPTCTLGGEPAMTGGTSAAAALVAARAATLLEQRTWTVAELRAALERPAVSDAPAVAEPRPPRCRQGHR